MKIRLSSQLLIAILDPPRASIARVDHCVGGVGGSSVVYLSVIMMVFFFTTFKFAHKYWINLMYSSTSTCHMLTNDIKAL